MSAKPYLPRSQLDNTSWCGQTCLANAIALYGLPTSIEECAGACREAGDSGTDTTQLARGLKHYGFKANAKLVEDKKLGPSVWRWVKSKLAIGQIVLCAVNGNYRSHCILLLRVVPGGVQVWDPNEELSKVVPLRNLFATWWNCNAPDDPEQQCKECYDVIAMSPRSKLAKRAVAIRRNLLYPGRGKLPLDRGSFLLKESS